MGARAKGIAKGGEVKRHRRLHGLTALTLAFGLLACERAADTVEDEAAAVETPVADGIISGSLSYPSDYIPDDMQVCAREITSDEVSCDAQRQGYSYTLHLRPGTYEVWAQTQDTPDTRAFYSEAVRCGLSVDCVDHRPIRIEVEAGQERAGVDPGDWYAGG